MQPYAVLIEFAVLAMVICGIHALRPKFGLVPIYVVFGLLEAFLFVAGMGDPTLPKNPMIVAQLYGAAPSQIASLLFLPLLLSVMVMVYILDGTKAARRLLLALVVVYVLHGVFNAVMAFHAHHPPEGGLVLEQHPLATTWLASRAASLGAVLLDALTIVIVFQFLRNRIPRLPLVLPLFLGLVAAMLMDSVAYSSFMGSWGGTEGLRFPEKFQAGIAAALPVSTYIAWQLKRHGGEITRESLGRGAFDIVDMSERMRELEARFDSLKGTFSKYVSPAVVERIVRNPGDVALGGETRDVTILFADIRGYSTLSESLEPSELIGILNRYFQQVAPCILERGGMINEFEGDGILAVFGAPLPLENHAARALEAAVDMMHKVEELNVIWEEDGTAAKWRNVGIDNLAVRVGIHTGRVVAGNIGTNLRMKYAVIGDTVNTAARVEGLNKTLKTNILVTDSVFKQAQAVTEACASLKDMGAHQVKGKGDKVHVYAYRKEGQD